MYKLEFFNKLKDFPLTLKVIIGATTVGTALAGGSLLYTLAHIIIVGYKTLQSLDANTLSIAESLKETTTQLADLQAQIDKLSSAQNLEQNTKQYLEHSPEVKSYFTYGNALKTVSIGIVVGVACFAAYSFLSFSSHGADIANLAQIMESLEKTLDSTGKTVEDTENLVTEIYDYLTAPD